MFNGLKSIRRERASMERTRVVFESMLEDDIIDEAMDSIESGYFEDVTDEEIEELIDKIPESDDNDEDEQIDRILNAGDEGLDIDEILGIDDTTEFPQ